MRIPTQQDVHAQTLLLKELREAWGRLNRPHINRDLRDSLYTRLLEVEAELNSMESTIRKQNAAVRRAATRKRTRKPSAAAVARLAAAAAKAAETGQIQVSAD